MPGDLLIPGPLTNSMQSQPSFPGHKHQDGGQEPRAAWRDAAVSPSPRQTDTTPPACPQLSTVRGPFHCLSDTHGTRETSALRHRGISQGFAQDTLCHLTQTTPRRTGPRHTGLRALSEIQDLQQGQVCCRL